MKNILIVFLVAFCISLFVAGKLDLRVEKDLNQATIADREYWRMVASEPEIACRLMGGEYRTTKIFFDFGTYKGTASYVCEDARD
jgi:hypothetical protein